MQDKELTRAGFGPRAAAYAVDRLILFAGLCVVRAPFLIASLLGAGRLTAKSFLFDHSFLDVLCWLAAAAYLVLLTYFTGGTLGKKLMRLRVEKEDGAPLSFVDALYRETIGRFLSGILCLGYLMVLADKRNRAFHDYLCDTRVVYDQVVFARRVKEAAPADRTPAPVYSLPGEEASPMDAAGETEPAPAPAEADTPAGPELFRTAEGWSIPGAAPAPADPEDAAPEGE